MTIIYFLFVLIVVILLYDLKKGVLLYAPWKLFFNLNVRVGPATFDLWTTIVILLIFLFRINEFDLKKFPLWKAFLIYGIGYSAGCIYPEFAPNFVPRIVISVLAFSVVYFFSLSSIKNIKWALLSFAIFAVVMCVNGLLAPLMNINPLDDFLQSVSDNDNSMFLDNTLIRMNQVRYRSFIPHPISYGVACAVILYLAIWSVNILDRSYYKLFNLVVIFLLLSGIVICGSRTPILGILPLGYWFVKHGKIKRSTTVFLFIITSVFIFLYGDYLLYSIESLFSSKVSSDAGGSSTDMRIRQYIIAWQVLQINPLWGMGMNFDAYAYNSDILGGESVWLPLMMNNGIIGVVVYAILFYNVIRISQKSEGKQYLLIVTIAWLIMRTATSLIGVTDAQFFCVYFCIYRYYELHSVNRHSRLQRRAVYSQVS